MACRGCSKQAKKDAAMRKSIEEAQAAQAEAPTPVPIQRLAIQCPGCGLTRMLPAGLKVGNEFTLVSCLKCGTSFRGIFVGNGVEQMV